MNYKFMPPGNYWIWKIGALGNTARWSTTIMISMCITIIWYLSIYQPVIMLCTRSSKTCIDHSALHAFQKEVEDLATLSQGENHNLYNISSSEEETIKLLQLYEKANLILQSCTHQKLYSKNNIPTEKIHCTVAGTLEQYTQFFDLLIADTIAIVTVECSIKKQHNTKYLGSITIEYASIGQQKTPQA